MAGLGNRKLLDTDIAFPKNKNVLSFLLIGKTVKSYHHLAELLLSITVLQISGMRVTIISSNLQVRASIIEDRNQHCQSSSKNCCVTRRLRQSEDHISRSNRVPWKPKYQRRGTNTAFFLRREKSFRSSADLGMKGQAQAISSLERWELHHRNV